MIREFKEETGLDVEPLNVISTYENFWNWDNKKCHQLCIYYRLKMKYERQELIPNPDTNNTKYVWVDLKELTTIKLYPLGVAELIINHVVDNIQTKSRTE